MSGRIQDWVKLFASVEGRKFLGAKITLYTVLFKIPNEEANACTSSDEENQTIYRKKAKKRKMEKCLFEHTKNKKQTIWM